MNQSYLDEIVLELINRISEADHTLMHGKPGILIALSYYYHFCLSNKLEKKVDEAIELCVNEIIGDIETKQLDGSLAFGITGISYALQTSSNLGQHKKINKNWFEELHQLILKYLEFNIVNKDYDFLRGTSGIVLYLMNYYPEKKFIDQYINSLYEEAIWPDDSKCYWIFYSFNEKKKILEYRDDTINLGLAHGISGIISILSELLTQGYNNEKCYKLIDGAINYLKSVELDGERDTQFCGIIYKHAERQNSSRLGWCYGDSSLGLAILKAGFYCKNSKWIDYGNMICLKSTDRKFNNAGLEEHGICHGYFGTMHMYNRLFQTTGIYKYRKSMEYWRKIAFEQREFSLSKFGFYQTEISNEKKIVKYSSNGILQGLAGIFLCIASYKKIEYSWDKLFLINIAPN